MLKSYQEQKTGVVISIEQDGSWFTAMEEAGRPDNDTWICSERTLEGAIACIESYYRYPLDEIELPD